MTANLAWRDQLKTIVQSLSRKELDSITDLVKEAKEEHELEQIDVDEAMGT